MVTLVQSAFAKREIATPNPQRHGEVATCKMYYDFTVAGATSQIVELGILPAFCVPTDAMLLMAGTMTGITADIGLMSGIGGTVDDAADTDRTVSNEIFNDVALDDADLNVRYVGTAIATIAPVAYDRGIGFKPSGTIAASAAKKLWLYLSYMQVIPGQP